MKYMGSKRVFAKELAIIMQPEPGDVYVEPMVGGANMITEISGIRIGGDINPYLIALLKALKDGWAPPLHISRDTYYTIKKYPNAFDPWVD